jgi:hypothetical protein
MHASTEDQIEIAMAPAKVTGFASILVHLQRSQHRPESQKSKSVTGPTTLVGDQRTIPAPLPRFLCERWLAHRLFYNN